MTSLQTELAHLVNLMAPPYRENWKAYAWAKAQILEQHNPKDYAGLPAALARAMQPASNANGPNQSCTNE
jgi:hypothetical protein